MSIKTTRTLHCDRCANWHCGNSGQTSGEVRRAAGRLGWRRRESRDLCPEHALPPLPALEVPRVTADRGPITFKINYGDLT